MVIRVPSGAQHSKYEIVSALRQALLVSFIPKRVCDHALQTARLLGLSSLQTELGSMLISTKRWISQVYSVHSGTLPCTCNQYPELSSQKRHGHIIIIFIPSWQYTGFGCKTVQAPMQPVLASTQCHRPGSIASAIRQSWRKKTPRLLHTHDTRP